MPRGNSLLLGIGGIGKKSLTKLSNFILTYRLFEIDINKDYNMKKNWNIDIKSILMCAGCRKQKVTFLIQDNQIIDEKMLVDLNNILNTGHVTNLYDPSDLEDINESSKIDCQDKGLDKNANNLFNQ